MITLSKLETYFLIDFSKFSLYLCIPDLTIGSLSLSMTSEHWQLLPDFAREHVLMPRDGSKEFIDVGTLLRDCGFAAMDTDAVLEEIRKYEERDHGRLEMGMYHAKCINAIGRGSIILKIAGYHISLTTFHKK